jgi:DNA polymerase-3 subunit epsilon
MDLAAARFWVIDVEGSGGSLPEVVELAMLEVHRLTLTSNQRHWFIKPEHGIHQSATRVHGLTDDDVIDAPAMVDIADDILQWIEGIPIVGHNVRVEVDILSRSIPDWSPPAAFDTLKLAKALRPGLPSYGLAKLGIELGLAGQAAERSGAEHHSALYDATLTALIFIDLLSPLTSERRAVALQDANLYDPKQGALL